MNWKTQFGSRDAKIFNERSQLGSWNNQENFPRRRRKKKIGSTVVEELGSD